MRLSIRAKLFFWIGGLALIFVLTSFLFNRVFFKPFYISNQKRIFLDISDDLAKLYESDRDNFETDVESREYREGLMISLYSVQDDNVTNLVSPNAQNAPDVSPDTAGRQELDAMRSRETPPPPGNRQARSIEDLFRPPPAAMLPEIEPLEKGQDYLFREMVHQDGLSMLTLIYKLEEGILLIVSRPMDTIDDSISIAERFSVLTGLFFLIFGTIAAILMSKFITNPVNELKSIAESMAELDFSRKYNVRSNDELGELGRSINSLSRQLNGAIDHLNKLNTDLLMEIEKERKIDEMRKNFIADVSHELRTPISLVEGYAEGLMDNVADDEEKRISYCRVILDETHRMERHVANLLTLSQLQSGVLPLEYEQYDIHQHIKDVLRKFEEGANKDGFTFHFSREDVITVRADKGKTEQVLSNYLRNALRYGSGEKKISVETEKRANGKIRVSVFNSGNPIAENNLERIWESYFKVDKARTRKLGGCGLGLSIVKAIQDQHGNRFGVKNAPGGVCFWFEMDPS